MAIISKPTGLSTEANLLYEILKEIDYLTKVISNTSGGATFTFSNGLDDLTNNIKWGGPLIQNTTISQGANDLHFTCTTKTPEYTADYSSIYTNRSFTDKEYVDSNLVSFPLSSPTITEDQKSIKWDNGTQTWIYYTLSPATYAFSNGLTETGGNVVLGGTLTGNTVINGVYNLTFQNNNVFTVQNISATQTATFSLQDGTVGINAGSSEGGGYGELDLGTQGASFLILDSKFEVFCFPSSGSSTSRFSIDSSGNILMPNALTFVVTAADGTFPGVQYAADYSANYTDRSLIDRGFANATYAAIPSDLSLKMNISPIENALSIINKLNPISFKYKNNPYKSFSNDYSGFIAQEIQQVLPSIVDENEKGYLQIKREQLVPYLVDAIKELSREINILKNQLNHA